MTILFCDAKYGELNPNASQARQNSLRYFCRHLITVGLRQDIYRLNLFALFVDGHVKAVNKQEYIGGLAYTP